MGHLRMGLWIILCLCLTGCERSSPQSEEKAIRQLSKQYAETFSKHDPAAVASFWAEDAVYTDPTTGASVEGRDALTEEFRSWFQTDNVDKLDLKVNQITFTDENEAIEEGTFRLTFKNDRPPLENAFRATLAKRDGRWYFEHIEQVPLSAAPSHYEELKELEWMVGSWVDTDDNVDVETTTRWDTHKNFLIQKFTMKLYGQAVIDGMQIIGWDPKQKRIRSWVFDSDGGFGEGKWSKNGQSWFVKSVFTLDDGSRASSTNTYTKENDNAFTWSSEERDINGAILPNIPPIKIVRTSTGEAP